MSHRKQKSVLNITSNFMFILAHINKLIIRLVMIIRRHLYAHVNRYVKEQKVEMKNDFVHSAPIKVINNFFVVCFYFLWIFVDIFVSVFFFLFFFGWLAERNYFYPLTSLDGNRWFLVNWLAVCRYFCRLLSNGVINILYFERDFSLARSLKRLNRIRKQF